MAPTDIDASASEKKFHPWHIECCVQECAEIVDSEHSFDFQGGVFCLYHHSVLNATKCVGCAHAITQANPVRDSKDESWHEACYLLHKVIDIWPLLMSDLTDCVGVSLGMSDFSPIFLNRN